MRYVAVAIAVIVILVTFLIYRFFPKEQNWKVILLAFWLVGPPLFSWFEYHRRDHLISIDPINNWRWLRRLLFTSPHSKKKREKGTGDATGAVNTPPEATDDFTKKLRDSQDASAKVWAGFGAFFILLFKG